MSLPSVIPHLTGIEKVVALRASFLQECNIFFRSAAHFFLAAYGSEELHRRSNWMILKWFTLLELLVKSFLRFFSELTNRQI